jgi:hypothetical protein
MAAAPDGRGKDGFRMGQYVMIHLPQPPTPSHYEDESVRRHLSNNHSLIIKGCQLDGPTSLDLEVIKAHKGSLDQHVDWHGLSTPILQ